jgi:uroporphyrinogen-III synthase
MTGAPLAGLGILVTRPAHQAAHLAELIRQAGGNPILFPALEIVDLPDLKHLHALIERLEQFDLAIFISPNAVHKALNLIRAQRELPPHLKIAAIGKGSRKALEQFGVKDVIAPTQRFDSEALLERPELQHIAGLRIVIFRGDGGRELLGDVLMQRGAHLEYAECYRRQKPQADNSALCYLWARNELNAVTVTSTEALRNLYEIAGKLCQQWLKKTPVFVTHERIAQTARELGLEQVYVTEAGDEGIVASIKAWRNK